LWVEQAYRDLLGREADPGGLAGWTGLVDQGHSRREVVSGIEATPEYRSRLVQSLYNTLLHRPADTAGLAGWAGALAAGTTTEQAEIGFIGSPEYFHNRGGSSDSGFLTAVYGDVLNRAIDPTGASAWETLLGAGHAPDGSDPRTFVARGVVASAEASLDSVQALYMRFLHRPTDTAGLAGWAGLIESGAGSAAVIVGVVSSDEYFQRAVTPSEPPIVILSPANGGVSTQNVTITGKVSPNHALVATLSGVTDNGAPSNVSFDAAGNFSFTTSLPTDGSADGDHVVHFQTADRTGHASADVNVTFTLNTRPGAVAAPGIDSSVVTGLFDSTAFLYSGSSPLQTGVAPGTIDAIRVAILRGRVIDRSGSPVSDVTVAVLNHPEFGTTQSRADGMFDMAVNGGETLTLRYLKSGYLMVQRQISVAWQNQVHVLDVVMTAADSNVTAVDLTSSAPVQVARGSIESDANGSRQATLFFPHGVQATMTLPDGSTQNLTSLHVRATEYSVGANGQSALPGTLPANVAYAYTFELNADEAVNAGATEITFSQALPFYVENFLNFPVGIAVPLASYDRSADVWHDSANGRIVKVLSITNGMADLDIDGSGVAAGAAALAALGMTDAERTQVAQTYQVGQSMWRVLIPHFTEPWDT
jgi:hypothetical protein